jgi:hypothetical protein
MLRNRIAGSACKTSEKGRLRRLGVAIQNSLLNLYYVPCNACKTNTLRRLGVARQNSYQIYAMFHATHVKQIPCDA